MVHAESKTAIRPPSKKKFSDLSTARPSELVSSPSTSISSPLSFTSSRCVRTEEISSSGPENRLLYSTRLPGWIICVDSRSEKFIIVLGAKAKLPDPLSGS